MDSNRSIFDTKEAGILDELIDVRYRIVQKFTSGDEIPTDEEDRQFLLKAMDGLERTILAKAKIKSDDRHNQNQEDMVDMVASVLKQIQFVEKEKVVEGQRQLQLDSSLQPTHVVPGEMDIGIKEQTFEQFLKKF